MALENSNVEWKHTCLKSSTVLFIAMFKVGPLPVISRGPHKKEVSWVLGIYSFLGSGSVSKPIFPTTYLKSHNLASQNVSLEK